MSKEDLTQETWLLVLRLKSLRTLLKNFRTDEEYEAIVRDKIRPIKAEIADRRNYLTKILKEDELLDG